MEKTPAQWMAEARKKRGLAQPQGQEVADPSPATTLFSDVLAEACKPYVEEVRRSLFGSSAAPFADREDAAQFEGDRARRWFRGRATNRDGRLREAEKELQRLGFRRVIPWIFWGEQPSLPRALMHVTDSPDSLTDGTPVPTRARVTLELTDRLRKQEWHIVARQVSVIFSAPSAAAGFDALIAHGRRITDLDYHLWRLRTEHSDMEWAEFLEKVWRTSPPSGTTLDEWTQEQGNVSNSALRKRWSRLQEKTNLDFTAEEENRDG